jgi:23S rRNA (pseudouridine1915-N3)-methyltransferase
MKLLIISIGDKMPSWIQKGFEEFQKRMPKECELKLLEIQSKNLGKNTLGDFIKKIPSKCTIIALDEHGESWNTLQLVKNLEKWKMSGKNIVFLIGGADGLDPELLKTADQCWSLSKLTFPHMFVRVLVAEQLYRAVSIISGHPYHRE